MEKYAPNTQWSRVLRVLVRRYPSGIHDGYAGGPEEFGNDFHRAAARVWDLKEDGFRITGRRRAGYQWFEYRFESDAIYHEAVLLVRSWDTGEDLDTLRKAEYRRRAGELPLDDRRPMITGRIRRVTIGGRDITELVSGRHQEGS